MAKEHIVILGGYGTYGSLITEQLAQSGVPLTIAGRDRVKGETFAHALKTKFIRCDVSNRTSLREVISGAYLVINASGPFQTGDYAIPQTCIEQGCHYIDLGDGRDYVAGISQLTEVAQARHAFVCVGASTSPAITSAAVAELRPQFSEIRSIKIALNAGNKNQAGVSTIASILSYVGLPVRVWQGGQWQTRRGWGMGEFVTFPKSVGRRRVQLCDVPDLELFPPLFEADNVVFKAGVELTLFNYALGALASLQQLRPRLNLPKLANLLVRLSALFKSFGTLNGSLAVWVTGEDGAEKSLAFVAPGNGPRIPAAPAVLLARKLLAEGAPAYGAFPCVGFLSVTEFASHLKPFGIFLVRGENGNWLS